MRRSMLMAALVVMALDGPATSMAQELAPGGYYADGAYYVPNAPAASTAMTLVPSTSSACPPGYGYPTLYVAQTATMVRIQQVSLVGGDAPGFPYLPVYASQAPC
jgi:hypothetical protein